jgi:protein-tyrosine phosphatase
MAADATGALRRFSLQIVEPLIISTSGAFAVTPLRVAFVDTGNTGRSMTCAALGRKWAQDNKANMVFISRALSFNPYNLEPEPDFVRLLAARGLDVSAHRAAAFEKGAVTFSDFIFVMTAAHRESILAEHPQADAKVFLMADYATGDGAEVPDAYGQSPEFYVRVFAQLNELVPLIMEKLPKT